MVDGGGGSELPSTEAEKSVCSGQADWGWLDDSRRLGEQPIQFEDGLEDMN